MPSRCFRPLDAWQLDNDSVSFDADAGKAGRPLQLPCGKCIGCLGRRAQAWALRCRHEALTHHENCFVTLTYRDDDLNDNALRYSDFQNFMKRLRKNEKQRLRYFVAGEYGDRTHRPHFHALLFGVDYRFRSGKRYSRTLYESGDIDRAWKAGRALVGELTAQSAAYVAQYSMKKLGGEDVDPVTGFVREPVVRMSKGIGSGWFERYGASDLRHDFAVLDDYKIPVPRYYRERLRAQDSARYEEVEHRRYLRAQEIPREERSRDRLAVMEQVALARRAHYHPDGRAAV